MRAWWLPALLVALITTLALPTDAQEDDDVESRVDLCIITYRPFADFRTIKVEADQVVSDENMTALLDEVDSDDDGTITSQEVAAYEDRSQHTERDFEALGKHKLVVDQDAPRSVDFRTVLRNFEGSIDEEKARLVVEHRTYRFPFTQEADFHWLEGGLYSEGEERPRDNIVEEFVVLEAPEGWIVGKVNDDKYAKQTVTLESFGTEEYFSILFENKEEETPANEIPGLDGMAFLAAIGVAALVAGRSRSVR
ncbi:MAG: hypothetical protein KY455_06440 [Euryarchaeota archaeon]|nr:hypothetical protein [Euryarchaeota archaeon]